MWARFVSGLILLNMCSRSDGSFYQPQLPQIFGIIEFKQYNGLIQIEVIDDRYVLVNKKTIVLQIPTWKFNNIRCVDIWLNTARILEDRDENKQYVRFVSRDSYNDLLLN
ncbi:hypothetical protein FGIG_00871 [Fasciola gigantica]|uniref:Uncharacterized protein n=1 Tax=Fasciola gigantica TaxID=46835 RepID=A0A504Z5G5_FASGI|nr:hypothetical protein FGIG_00871 [Fasciola gigantica]